MASSARPSLYGSHRCCSRKTSYCSFSSSFIYSPLLVTSESENDAVHHKRYHLTGNILNEASGSGLWPKSYSISVGEGGLLCTSQMSNRQLLWANSPPLWHLTLTVYKRSQWRWTVHSADNKIIISLYPCKKRLWERGIEEDYGMPLLPLWNLLIGPNLSPSTQNEVAYSPNS